MAERRFLQQGKVAIQIATETAGAGATAVGPFVVRSVQEIARLLSRGLEEMTEGRPDHLEMRFGLGIAPDGSILITLGDTGKNFDVTLSWGDRSEAVTPTLPQGAQTLPPR